MSRGQQRILHEVEGRLQAEEPGLELVFAAFARVTRAGNIPAAEQLGSWAQGLRAARQVRRIARWPALARVTGVIVAGVLVGLAIGLPVISIQHQASCWRRPSAGAAIAGRCHHPGTGIRSPRSASPGYRLVPSFPWHRQLP
ncbi:MAG: hypothetical protein LBI49_24030 [Nocardiopsaceae bacterium]|nr:hypothetical protein [Nocardiopsaceae bacterium]